MDQRRIVALLCLGLFAVTAQAAGTRELIIPPDRNGPQILARLWTPCAIPPGPITVNRGTVRLTIRGVKDCAPSSKHLPLIVISHGGKAMSFQCIDDPPGFERADFHRDFNAQVLEFFRKHSPSHERQRP